MRRAKTGDPKLAIGYIRVSTDEQRLGPEAQRAAIEAWADKEWVRIVAWHEDVVSGGSELEDREGLIRALGELRALHAGILVVAKRDRLARDVAIGVTIEKAVERCGARVASADGIANGDSAADAFMRTILDAAAAYERALIRARTKAALAVKKAQGLRVGSVPLGSSLAPDGRTLVVCAREQAVIAEAKGLRAQGLSMGAIAKGLNARGVKPRSGKVWHPHQVATMLSR